MTDPQYGKERYVVRPWWRGRTLPWASLVICSMVLTVIALERTAFFVYVPVPEFIDRLRTGRLCMFAGSAMSLAAAVWSQIRGNQLWVTICVATPAALVGLATMIMTAPSLTPHIAGVFALPAALAGLLGGLLGRRRNQVMDDPAAGTSAD